MYIDYMKHLFILLFAFTLILKTSISFALKHGFNHEERFTLSEQHNDQKNSNHSDCHSSKMIKNHQIKHIVRAFVYVHIFQIH